MLHLVENEVRRRTQRGDRGSVDDQDVDRTVVLGFLCGKLPDPGGPGEIGAQGRGSAARATDRVHGGLDLLLRPREHDDGGAAAASSIAMLRPMPRPLPVTRATRPLRSGSLVDAHSLSLMAHPFTSCLGLTAPDPAMSRSQKSSHG